MLELPRDSMAVEFEVETTQCAKIGSEFRLKGAEQLPRRCLCEGRFGNMTRTRLEIRLQGPRVFRGIDLEVMCSVEGRKGATTQLNT